MNYTMRYTQYLSGILSEADFYEMDGPDSMPNGAPQMGGHEKIQGLTGSVQTSMDRFTKQLEDSKMNLNAAKQVLSEVVSILHLQHKLNRQKIMDVINEVMNQVPPEM